MTTTPSGWYDDGHGAMRWWDGANWTEHTAARKPDQPGAGFSYAPAGAAHPEPDPNALPGAYPDPGGGAVITAAEPRTSKMWIVWVVLGVVLLGIVIALALLIPIMLTGVAAERGGDSAASAPDQEAATDAVELYNDAWLDADCDAYFASTTEALREEIEITDCGTFERAARGSNSGVDDYELTVTSVETVGPDVTVYTSETYVSRWDEDGNVTDEPEEYEDLYQYIVIETDGEWVIDSYFIE